MNITDKMWIAVLSDVMDGESAQPRGVETKELLAYTSSVPMTLPVITILERVIGYRFMAAEAAWILSGDNRLSTVGPYAKHLHRFSDDGLTFRGAYGPKFIDQEGYVVETLDADPDSRQAVMTLWRERPRPTKDVPCTVALQWLVRNGRLHCITTMRSSDAWMGWPYDVHTFSMMSAHVLLSLQHKNPRWKDVVLGDLFLTAGSQHLYEKNFEAATIVVANRDDLQSTTVDIAPLNLEQFDNPDHLTNYLWGLAKQEAWWLQRSSPRWLRETIFLGKVTRLAGAEVMATDTPGGA